MNLTTTNHHKSTNCSISFTSSGKSLSDKTMKDLRDWVIVPILTLLHFMLPAYLFGNLIQY